jgi:hypothetical protein
MAEYLLHYATRVALAALLIGAAGPAFSQGKKKQEKPPKPSWPVLSKTDQAKGKKWIGLIGSKKVKIREQAAAILKGLGLGIADRLFKRLTDSPGRDVNEHVIAVLDQILKPEHAELVSLHAKHKSVAGRRYVMKRLANYGRTISTPAFEHARKDKDVEVAYYASLGLIKTTRDAAALDSVFARCVEEWGEVGDEVTRILTPARSDKFNPWIGKKLASSEVNEQTTALRMMRSLAPETAKTMVRPLLDSDQSILKKEAINTLRVIVDGKEPMPLRKITVFLVIKLAKEWKQRI